MNNKTRQLKNSTYFEKRVEEEDEPVTLDEDTQAKYEALDDMYEEFFEEDFLGVAKVILI